MKPLFRTLPTVVRDAALDALAVLSPIECAGCGAQDRSLCRECRAGLGRPAPPSMGWTGGGAEAVPVWSALEYEGSARKILLAYKEEGRTGIASALAVPLARSLDAALAARGVADGPGIGHRRRAVEAVEFAIIPSSRAAFRERGYHPTALVLARAGHRASRVLRAARQTEDQARLGLVEREWNRAGSLRASRSADGRVYLIVDDILTTGATVREAARALRAAGGSVVGASTIAVTRRRASVREGDRGPPEMCGDFQTAWVYGR